MATYGGVYLSNNAGEAMDHAENASYTFGGKPMLIVVQTVKNSGNQDEDWYIQGGDTLDGDIEEILDNPRSKKQVIIQRLKHMLKVPDPTKDVTSLNLLNKLYTNWIKNYRKTDDIMDYQESEEFRDIMVQLMNRSRSGHRELTMKIQRPIGYSGKTRIIGILDPEGQKVLYKDRATDFNFAEVFDQL